MITSFGLSFGVVRHKGKWVWSVWANMPLSFTGKPVASGCVKTKKEVIEKAKLYGFPEIDFSKNEETNDYLIEYLDIHDSIQSISLPDARKKSLSSDLIITPYVFSHKKRSFEQDELFKAHFVFKSTDKSLYVERIPISLNSNTARGVSPHMIVCRKAMSRYGFVHVKSFGKIYSQENKNKMSSVKTNNLFGLVEPFTKSDIKQVYKKLASIHHPDNGGNESEFIKYSNEKNRLLDMIK